MEWVVLDAPLDSSGNGRGEQRAPAALRATGLISRLRAADGGRVAAEVSDPRRDPETGLVGAEQVRQASRRIGEAVGTQLDADRRPLVLGGDCTIMVGIALALPPVCDLWFLDGHPDFLDGRTSPTGEGADMDLSLVTGHGPTGVLAALDGPRPLVDPQRVDLVGHRTETDEDARQEAARVDPRVRQTPAAEVRRAGADRTSRRLAAGTAPAWLHLDLDVLDQAALPAVTYPQPDGLDWADLVALLRPLAASGRLIGASVADFNPDLDPNGEYAARIVDALYAGLAV